MFDFYLPSYIKMLISHQSTIHFNQVPKSLLLTPGSKENVRAMWINSEALEWPWTLDFTLTGEQ